MRVSLVQCTWSYKTLCVVCVIYFPNRFVKLLQ